MVMEGGLVRRVQCGAASVAGEKAGIKEVDERIWLGQPQHLQSRLYRPGAENFAAAGQPVRPSRYPCLRNDLSPMSPGWTRPVLAEGESAVLVSSAVRRRSITR